MATQVAYCQRSELSTWGAPESAIEDIDTGVLDQCIAGASSLIDGYLKDQVILPLLDWGVDIRRAAAIIAAYDLIFGARGVNPVDDGGNDSPLLVRYKAVIDWLKDIAKGLVTSSAVGSPAPPPATHIPGRATILSNIQRGWQDDSIDGSGGAFSGRRR